MALALDALAPYSVVVTVQVGGVDTLLTSTAAVAVVAGPLDAAASTVLSAAGVPLAAAAAGASSSSSSVVGVGVAGEAMTLTVALRDAAGRALDSSAAPAPPVLFSSFSASVAVVEGVPAGVAGAYTVTLTSTVAGQQVLSATVGGLALGAGKFALRISPGAADASKAIVSGPGVPTASLTSLSIVAGQLGRVTIASRDRFGNPRAGGGFFDTYAYAIGTGSAADSGFAVAARRGGSSEGAAEAGGTYELSYLVTQAAKAASLTLTLVETDGATVSPAAAVADSPYVVDVVAAAMDASASALDTSGAGGGGGNRVVVAGNALVLPITAKDAFGNLASLVPAPDVTITMTPSTTTTAAAATATVLTGTVSSLDEGTGTIDITVPGNGVVVTAAGDYALAASLTGIGGGALPIGGSPVTVTVVSAPADPASSSAAGPGLNTGVAASTREFSVTLKDAFGNPAVSASSSAATTAAAVTTTVMYTSPDAASYPWLSNVPSSVTAEVTPPGDGGNVHGVSFATWYPGTYVIVVTVNGGGGGGGGGEGEIAGSPFTLSVAPAPASSRGPSRRSRARSERARSSHHPIR